MKGYSCTAELYQVQLRMVLQDGTSAVGWYSRRVLQDGIVRWYCKMVLQGGTSTVGWTDKILELQVKQTLAQTCANLTGRPCDSFTRWMAGPLLISLTSTPCYC